MTTTRRIKAGTTDVSVIIRIIDSTDGTPETGVVFNTSGIDLKYRREGEANVDITEATLAALTTAHADGGFLTVGHGYYRLDLPDAACAAGATGVLVHGIVTGMVVIGTYIELVAYDPYDTVRLGLTALPNAVVNAANGLYTRGTGAGQINQPANGLIDVNVENWNTTAVPAEHTAGYPIVTIKDGTGTGELDTASGLVLANVTQLGGSTQSATDLKDFADDGYDPATNKVQGVVLVDTLTTYTGNTPQTGDSFARLGAPAGASVSADIAAIEAQTDDIGAAGAGLTAVPWNSTWDAEVQSEVDDALVAQNLDHLVKIAVDTDFATTVHLNSVVGHLADNGTAATFDRTTDSLEAIRDRGDAAWVTGGGGSITDLLNVTPLIPISIDLANTATWRLGLMLTNALDDLPTTAEITPGTISIDRKAIGGTSWTAVETDTACSESAGLVYFDEVFDTGTGYAEGDSLRITFKSQKITVAANDYEVTDSTGRIFYTEVRQTERGTNSAATATALATAQADLDDIQARLPAALVGGRIDANVGAISSDAVAADNAEAFFDGTGYAGTGNVIPTVTTTATATNVTTVNGLAANVITATSIANDAITAAKIADGAIDAATFAAGAIDAGAIAADAIGASELAASAVTEIQSGLSTLTAAQVNAEVLDVLNVDTFAEPGQESPPATTTLVKKLGYLYKFLRNKKTQTSTTLSVFADDGTTVDQKAIISDDNTTYVHGELSTGP